MISLYFRLENAIDGWFVARPVAKDSEPSFAQLDCPSSDGHRGIILTFARNTHDFALWEARMRISCDKCGTNYNVEDARIPAIGLTMKCTRCPSLVLSPTAGRR